MRDLFEPKTEGFVKTTFNDFESVKKYVTEKTCAIMIEPIQGEGGVNIATADYVKSLRDLFFSYLMKYRLEWEELESYFAMNIMASNRTS